MLQRVVDLLLGEPGSKESEATKPELAAAVLMMEVVAADHEDEPEEQQKVLSELIERFELSHDDAVALRESASDHIDSAIALDNYVGAVNESFDARQKFELIRSLWRVAFADGELHHYEEYAIRRIADLIYVPHREFIRAKHEAGVASSAK